MEHQDFGHPRTIGQYARLAITGFFMGVAELIPGVSGGTIAFITGIYETLLNTIKSINGTAIKLLFGRKFGEFANHINLRFIIGIGIGTLIAFILLARFLGNMIDTQPAFLFAFFGGLVLGSIWLVGSKLPRTLTVIAGIIGGAVFAYWLVGLPLFDASQVSHDPLTLFLSGVVAIMAMILPGISGSYVLTVLGQYRYVLDAVAHFTDDPAGNIVILGSVALGCLVGILSIARLISYALKHYEAVTLAVLTGLMIGSLRTIVTKITEGLSVTSTTLGITEFGATQWVIMAVCVLIGLGLVVGLERFAPKAEPETK